MRTRGIKYTWKWALLALLVTCCSLLGRTVQAQKLSPEQNYALNRPGVVMVKTIYSATVYVNRVRMDNRELNRLLDSIYRQDTSGVIYTASEKLDILLQSFQKNPQRFFKTTLDYITQTEYIISNGTGFFISSDGMVATNCHLIEPDNAFIRRSFIASVFKQVTKDNIQSLESSWATTFSEQQRSLLGNTFATVYSKVSSMFLYDLKKTINVEYRLDSEKGDAFVARKEAKVLIKGKAMPGKDIAILKIEPGIVLPTLSISVNATMNVGQQLLVYGYPGPVSNNDFLSDETSNEPTLTAGILSAIKKSIGGWPVIQMDANINHGNSGGPVCNDLGEVVGLTTFGSLESGNSRLAAGLNFAIPVSILNEYIDSAHLQLKPSKATSLFAESLKLLNEQYYSKALSKLEDVKKINKQYPGVEHLMEQTRSLVESATDRQTVVVLRVTGVLLIVALLITLYLIRKKKMAADRPSSIS